MNEVVVVNFSLSSIEVAEMMEKDHSNLMRDIKKYNGYLSQVKIESADFWQDSTYKDAQKKERPCYIITKKGCEFLAHKTTGAKGTAFTARYINRFHEMEDAIRQKSVITPLLPVKNTNPLPLKRDKWHHRNMDKIAAVCKYRDNAPIKEFYHQFLIRLNTNGYDVDELNDIFFKERGRMPQHTGELIEHFSEMEREADEYLQYLWSRTPKWREINSKS